MSKIVLITGGRRSGKSWFAEQYALQLSSSPVYLATGVRTDEEFAARIERHQRERDTRFMTIEEPLQVGDVLKKREKEVILWECMTTWLANRFYALDWSMDEEDEKAVYHDLFSWMECVRERDHTLLVVTNEVGLGIIPADEVSRRYSDVLGRCNQMIASVADEVYFLVSGIAWRLR